VHEVDVVEPGRRRGTLGRRLRRDALQLAAGEVVDAEAEVLQRADDEAPGGATAAVSRRTAFLRRRV
jgi:hypothetical protein